MANLKYDKESTALLVTASIAHRHRLIAHACVEATVRYAAELGYEITVVKDATADYSNEEMHAALYINIPNYASAIVTTDEIGDSRFSLWTVGTSVGR
jgi:isochorismate hydrolase